MKPVIKEEQEEGSTPAQDLAAVDAEYEELFETMETVSEPIKKKKLKRKDTVISAKPVKKKHRKTLVD